MKRLMTILTAFVISLGTLYAQPGRSIASIKSVPISLCTEKTTNLVFAYAIKSVDRGSNAILAQVATGADNILQVKAGKEQFSETNLSVITADGGLYSFSVTFSCNPPILNLIVPVEEPITARKLSGSPAPLNDVTISEDAERVAELRERHKIARQQQDDMMLQLDNIYIHDNVMYLRLKLSNSSNIDYSIDALRLFLRDRKTAKRTAVQEVDLAPLHTHGNAQEVKAQSSQLVVLAVPKFTIPDKKYVTIQLLEKNGGRNLTLTLGNKKIVRATAYIPTPSAPQNQSVRGSR